MSRNQYRILSDQEIVYIKRQIASDLKQYSNESADIFIDFYLNNDADGLFSIIKDWIETAEDDVIKQINMDAEDEVIRQLNMDLIEDSFDNEYYPNYDI
jgi:hypothetical protein